MTDADHPWIRQVTLWQPERPPAAVRLDELRGAPGFPWIELACGADRAAPVLKTLAEHCPGLTQQMLEDLLTPDDEPEGLAYDDGRIRLASSFGVETQRPEERAERGEPQGVGVLVFQPVELLASADWLITCWHPQRTFQGAAKILDGPPGDADSPRQAAATRWQRGEHASPGDLGVLVMNELALTYAPTHRTLHSWLEDWELSLYLDDDLDNHDQLPELWGLMAVLRNWLNPLNKPGLQADIGKAWLPVTNHGAVIEVDNRIDKALAALARLSETLRQSFGLFTWSRPRSSAATASRCSTGSRPPPRSFSSRR